MNDIVVAFGLVLVLEGLLWALRPDLARQLLEIASATEQSKLRRAGWTAVAAGAFLVWLMRG
jgi:uncharacterized protein YjeT (DUF2065 family)